MQRAGSGTGGALAAFALAAAAGTAGGNDDSVLLAAAAHGDGVSNIRFIDVEEKLTGTGHFGTINRFDAGSATPELSELLEYDVVLTWTNIPYDDPSEMGSVLADYIDEGGAVVVAVFATSTNSGGHTLGGRWNSEEYWIIRPRSGNIREPGELGSIEQPDHPIVQGVSTFATGDLGYRPSWDDLSSHGEMVARWHDDMPLVATSNAVPGRVDLGFYPPSADVDGRWWDPETDGAMLMGNALVHAIESSKPVCVADWNDDGRVNINDFFAYLDDFEAGAPRADLNGNGQVNIIDFFLFLLAFDEGC